MSLWSSLTKDPAAATPERSFDVISRDDWLMDNLGWKDHFTSPSINQWAYNIYFNRSDKREDDHVFTEGIPLEGDHFIHGVPKHSTCSSIFDDTEIHILTVRPHLPFAPSKGFVAEVMEGMTFKEKDGRLPGMQILGGSIKLEDESPPVHILAIQPDEDFTRYPGSANVIVGLTEREASMFWGSLASTPRTAQRTMEPDHFPSIQRTCDAVSQAVTQWRRDQSAASKKLPVDDQDLPSSLAGSKWSGEVRSRIPYRRKTDDQ